MIELTTPCSKKGAIKLIVVTKSNFNRFLKYLNLERETNFQQNPHIISHRAQFNNVATHQR